MYVLFFAWIMLKNFLWFLYVTTFLLLNHIVSTLFKEWTLSGYKLPKATFYIAALIGLVIFILGSIVYITFDSTSLFFISLYATVILITTTHTFRFLHFVILFMMIEEDKFEWRKFRGDYYKTCISYICLWSKNFCYKKY
jgi:hypothetical protein